MNMNQIVKELKEGKKGVAIWGLGYIGYSSMAYLARAGIKCLGYDLICERIKQINETGKIRQRGEMAIPNMEYWLGFDTEPMHKQGLMKATSVYGDLLSNDYPVHLIAVPTEKTVGDRDIPCSENLENVIVQLANYKGIKTDYPPLAIIESTLSVNILDDLIIPKIESYGLKVGEDFLLGVAPRRDWFTDGGKNLKTIPRIVGGTNKKTTELMKDVLNLICDRVLPASDHKHAAIVKGIENAYRQVEITLANQLSAAYQSLDMTEILKLVGTKWNIGTYHPSFGIGGYCIPLAPYYVLEGAEDPEQLTLLKNSVAFDEGQPSRVINKIIKNGSKNIGIMGIAYMADLKVHILSPALKIARGLKKAGLNTFVNDPYYTDEELKRISGVDTFNFPEDLLKLDTLLINAGHMHYKFVNEQQIKDNLKNCKLILDNIGIWKGIPFNQDVEYHEAGDKNWL
jgi:nucleotide sugar dehydrogenase